MAKTRKNEEKRKHEFDDKKCAEKGEISGIYYFYNVKKVERVNQHQDQKQQDSEAMFFKSLATTKFCLSHGLLKCLT